MKGVSFCPDYPATVFESVCIYNQRKSDVSQRGVLVCWCFQLQPCSATDYLIIRKALATSVELKNQRVWQFSGSRFFFSLFASTGGWSALCEEPWQYHPPPNKTKKNPSCSPTTWGCLAGRHVSMYLPTVCLFATVANQFLINHLKASSAIPFISPPQSCRAN